MKIIFMQTASSRRSKHLAKLPTVKERYEYLTKGEIKASEWMDTTNHKRYYRPELNGVSVVDANSDKFLITSVPKAIREGERILDYIKSEIPKL